MGIQLGQRSSSLRARMRAPDDPDPPSGPEPMGPVPHLSRGMVCSLDKRERNEGSARQREGLRLACVVKQKGGGRMGGCRSLAP